MVARFSNGLLVCSYALRHNQCCPVDLIWILAVRYLPEIVLMLMFVIFLAAIYALFGRKVAALVAFTGAIVYAMMHFPQ